MTWQFKIRSPKLPQRLMVALVAALFVASTQASIEPFLGRYEGKAVVGGSGEIQARDIAVTIEPKGKGFRLEWTAIIYKGSGKTKRKAFSIDFLPSKRPGLYSSAMRRNLFGQPVPLDPLKGDPYVWCKLDGKSLIVHALLITERGGYELQVYKRTLKKGGLELEYMRVRDNQVLRKVTGELVKIE